MVNAAVAEHLKVLGLMPLTRAGVVEGIHHAHAFDGLLLHAVDGGRLRETGGFENRRRDVYYVMELRPDLAFCFDPFRPVHDGAVARTTPMGCNLLGPLVRR